MPQMYAPKLSATTVLILERNQEECQIFVLKRKDRGGFLKDAIVFPGGVVENEDLEHADPIRAAAVREIKEETGLLLKPLDLQPFSWWLTPKVETKRFDTHFFVARYPVDQEPCINPEESDWGRLMTPSEILAQHAQKELRLMPPTILTLETIQGLKSFTEIAQKAKIGQEPICPKLEEDASGQLFLTISEGLGFRRNRFKVEPDGRFS